MKEDSVVSDRFADACHDLEPREPFSLVEDALVLLCLAGVGAAIGLVVAICVVLIAGNF